MEAVAYEKARWNQGRSQAATSLLAIIAFIVVICLARDPLLRLLSLANIAINTFTLIKALPEIVQSRQALRNLPPDTKLLMAENRLNELESLKRRDMVTPEEYAAKRLEILKEL